jgi:hypothetical protein
MAGAIALAALVPVAFATDLLEIGLLTTALMLAVCVWEEGTVRRRVTMTAR